MVTPSPTTLRSSPASVSSLELSMVRSPVLSTKGLSDPCPARVVVGPTSCARPVRRPYMPSLCPSVRWLTSDCDGCQLVGRSHDPHRERT